MGNCRKRYEDKWRKTERAILFLASGENASDYRRFYQRIRISNAIKQCLMFLLGFTNAWDRRLIYGSESAQNSKHAL